MSRLVGRRHMSTAQAMASLCGSTTDKENFYEPNVGLYDGPFRRLDSESDTDQSPERPSGSRSGTPLTGSSNLYNSIRHNRRPRTNLSEFQELQQPQQQQPATQGSWITAMLQEQQSAQEKVLTTLQQIQKKQCDFENKLLTMEREMLTLKRQQDSSSSSSPSSAKKKKRVTRDLTVSSYECV